MSRFVFCLCVSMCVCVWMRVCVCICVHVCGMFVWCEVLGCVLFVSVGEPQYMMTFIGLTTLRHISRSSNFEIIQYAADQRIHSVGAGLPGDPSHISRGANPPSNRAVNDSK